MNHRTGLGWRTGIFAGVCVLECVMIAACTYEPPTTSGTGGQNNEGGGGAGGSMASSSSSSGTTSSSSGEGGKMSSSSSSTSASSSSSTTTSSSSGSTSSSSSSSSGAATATVDCGSVQCEIGQDQFCCVNPVPGATRMCRKALCNAGEITIKCDEKADCESDRYCCDNMQTPPTLECAPTCIPVKATVCQSSADCPDSGKCVLPPVDGGLLPDGLGRCE